MNKLNKIIFLLSLFFLPFGIKIGEIIHFPGITYIYNLSIFISIILLLINNKFKISLKVFPSFLSMFLIYTIIHIFIVYALFCPKLFFKPEILNFDAAFINCIRYLIFILFTYVFVSLADYDYNKKLITAFTFGYLFTFFIGYIAILLKWMPVEVRLEGRFTGGFDNPNTFGVQSIMILFLNLFILLTEKEKKGRLIYTYLIPISIAVIGIFISQSRMSLFGLLLGLMLLFYKIPSINKKTKILLLLVPLFGILLLIVPKEVYLDVFHRISSHSLSGTTGQQESRIIIWEDYLKQIPKFGIQGVGFFREISVVSKSYRTYIPLLPHNMYLSILVSYGIVGLVLFIFSFVELYLFLKNKLRFLRIKNVNSFSLNSLLILILIWVIILFNLGQYQNSRDFWLLIAIAISANKLNYEKN